MHTNLKLLYFLFDLILPLVAGYLMRRRGWGTERTFTRMMWANFLTLQPLLCLLSIWIIHLKGEMLWLPVLGVIMQVVPGAIGWVWMRGRTIEPLEKGSYLLACMLSNRGTVGIVSVYVLAGEAGYGMSVLVMLLAQFVVQFIAFPMSAHYAAKARPQEDGETTPWWRLFVNLKQVPLIGIAVGLGLNLGGVVRPPALDGVFPWLVHAMSWLFIVPIGYGLDFTEMKAYWRRAFDLVAIKFVLTPLAVALVVFLLPLDPTSRLVVLILACSPTAINAVVVAKLHDLNTHMALTAFMLTTMIYLVAVLPLFLWLAGRFSPAG